MISGKNILPDTLRLAAHPLGKFNDVATLPITHAEIAFLGRSNSGKSSLLRALLSTEKPPQISSRPGSTRLIQLYRLGGAQTDNRLTLADFPGYGYAKSSAVFRKRYEQFLLDYITRREHVKAICLVMDARRSLGEEEHEICRIVKSRRIPLLLCLNKGDQLNQAATAKLKAAFAQNKDFFEIMLISATKKTNLEFLRNYIASLG